MIPIRDHSDHSDRPDRLARLLGPGEAELGCEQCFEALDRYVDAYLAGADADRTVPGMRAHLAGCPACASEHADLLAFVASSVKGTNSHDDPDF